MTAQTNIYRGIALILVATLGIVLMNPCAKMRSLAYGPVEMVFYRGLVALDVLVPCMLLTRPWSAFKPRRIRVHLIRALVSNLGVAFVFWAYALLPMAEALLLSPRTYTAIIWAALAGWLLWKEFLSPAVIAGTLVVIGSNLFIAWRETRHSQV